MTGPSLPAATTTANCEAVLDEIQRVVVGQALGAHADPDDGAGRAGTC